MHATDSMVEMFSTAFNMEKGALGLFFEMNLITGIFVSFYTGAVLFFWDEPTFKPGQKKLKEQYQMIISVITAQFIYNVIAFVLSFVVACIYRCMERQYGQEELEALQALERSII